MMRAGPMRGEEGVEVAVLLLLLGADAAAESAAASVSLLSANDVMTHTMVRICSTLLLASGIVSSNPYVRLCSNFCSFATLLTPYSNTHMSSRQSSTTE